MVRLIVYNIEYCEGMTGLWWEYLYFWRIFFPPPKLDQEIVEQLKKLKPDILALVEVDTGSFRAKKDEVVFFEQKLGMKSFVEKVKYPIHGWLKLFHHIPILDKQANAIIAKKKLSHVKYHVFHEGTKRLIIEATIHLPKKVTMLLAHLALGGETRVKQIKELIAVVNNIKNPVILMGDFNTFHGEKEIQILLDKTHLHHKFSMDKLSQTLTQPTYHPSRRLDYVLTSKQIKVKKYNVLNYHFSDHLPLLIDFDVKK
ncbi:endonuclease/exonuclease/phosphatase family protein [Candidatus Woesearchaeota archaeon]|nr:endonuclease/exonuclease/phosphatase family protein [Candidatus Woesearchaeota archaeon]